MLLSQEGKQYKREVFPCYVFKAKVSSCYQVFCIFEFYSLFRSNPLLPIDNAGVHSNKRNIQRRLCSYQLFNQYKESKRSAINFSILSRKIHASIQSSKYGRGQPGFWLDGGKPLGGGLLEVQVRKRPPPPGTDNVPKFLHKDFLKKSKNYSLLRHIFQKN